MVNFFAFALDSLFWLNFWQVKLPVTFNELGDSVILNGFIVITTLKRNNFYIPNFTP